MRKSMLIIVMLLLIVPASLFSIDLIGLRVGPTAMLNTPVDPDHIPPGFLNHLKIDDFSFGIDARFNLTVLEVNALALVEPVVDEFDNLGALVTVNAGAGVSVPLADIVRLGIFAGPAVSFAVTGAGFEPGEDFPVQVDDLFASNLYLRLTADVMLGDLSIGGTYIINTNTNLNDIIGGTFDPATIMDNLEGKAGVSVLFSLF